MVFVSFVEVKSSKPTGSLLVRFAQRKIRPSVLQKLGQFLRRAETEQEQELPSIVRERGADIQNDVCATDIL